MNNWASKLLTLTILGLFSFSLILVEYFQPNKDINLQDLIVQVKELQQTTEDNASDFQIVFSNTITFLNNLASINASITPHTDNNKPENIRIVVKTRTPYLLNHFEPVKKVVFYQLIIPAELTTLYKSHLIPPETPPPIFS